MNIIGALKKSKVPSTVYFCKYNQEDFDWDEVVDLLNRCCLQQDLNDRDIYCIAIESADELKSDKRMVGVTFRDGDYFVSITPQGYSDLEVYLNELSESASGETE